MAPIAFFGEGKRAGLRTEALGCCAWIQTAALLLARPTLASVSPSPHKGDNNSNYRVLCRGPTVGYGSLGACHDAIMCWLILPFLSQ